MLVYIRNKAFPLKTFLVSVFPNDKIARVRGQLLHILYELGKEDHHFRLQFKGQVLRDALTVTDYGITDNAVVSMVPMGKSKDTLMEIRSRTSSSGHSDPGLIGQPVHVKNALEEEVRTFDRREKFIGDFKALLYIHCLATCLAVLTTRWYAAVWLGVLCLLGVVFVPTYSRLGGFVGNKSQFHKPFSVVAGVSSIACLFAALYLAISEWISIANDGCTDWMLEGSCSHRNVYTAIYFTLHSVLLIVTSVLAWILHVNFRIQVGDLIEKCLVQERDIEDIMSAARNGTIKEKCLAAFDLAVMAASSDDNKFQIVAEGGLDTLVTLAMSRDEATQENALEALSEILTIPSIQDTFVESGGISTLTALLHSGSPRAMQEAGSALYNIIAESEENKTAVVADHGLEDLAHAAREGTILCQRTVASILLELAFNSEIRSVMAAQTSPAQTLIHLCHSEDPDTLRFALQTLEILAIESSDLICSQEDLLSLLINLPFHTMEEHVFLLGGKILLYFAENQKTCRQLLAEHRLQDSFMAMVRTHNAMLQKVVVKIVYCILEVREFRFHARELNLDAVLEYARDYAADRDAWDMADECLHLMNSTVDNLADLPTLSTLEKVNKMTARDSSFGSRTSLSSEGRGESSGSKSSISSVKKGIA